MHSIYNNYYIKDLNTEAACITEEYINNGKPGFYKNMQHRCIPSSANWTLPAIQHPYLRILSWFKFHDSQPRCGTRMCLHVLTIKWEISGELSMILGSFLGLNEKVPEFNAGIFCIGNHVYIYILQHLASIRWNHMTHNAFGIRTCGNNCLPVEISTNISYQNTFTIGRFPFTSCRSRCYMKFWKCGCGTVQLYGHGNWLIYFENLYSNKTMRLYAAKDSHVHQYFFWEFLLNL